MANPSRSIEMAERTSDSLAPAHPRDPEVEQRLRADLAFIARPRHARWDESGLLAVRSMLLERLAALGPVEEHHFQEHSDAGVNLIVKIPGQRHGRHPRSAVSDGRDRRAGGAIAGLGKEHS